MYPSLAIFKMRNSSVRDGPPFLDSQFGRDSQRIYQLVRQRIRPISIRVDFADVRGYTVCSVFVPRREEPLHFLDGVNTLHEIARAPVRAVSKTRSNRCGK